MWGPDYPVSMAQSEPPPPEPTGPTPPAEDSGPAYAGHPAYSGPPAHPDGSRRNRPWLTYALMAACALVWLGQWLIPGFTEAIMFVPFLGPVEPWRFLTAAFGHSESWTHLFGNMACLWIVGSQLEPALGRWRFAVLYLVSALAGNVAFAWLSFLPSIADLITNTISNGWFTPTLGASGAVFGLFGALLAAWRRSTNRRGLLILLAINAAIGLLVPQIAWQAHLGGFVAGFALGLVMARRPRFEPLWLVLITLAVLVLGALRYLIGPSPVGPL